MPSASQPTIDTSATTGRSADDEAAARIGEPSAERAGGARAGESGASKGDVYIDAARELSQEVLDPVQAAFDADREKERIANGDPDVVLAPEQRGDEPVDDAPGAKRAADDPAG